MLVDWGMARRTDAQSGGISQGTPAYASPEQLTGHNVGSAFGTARLMPATDVWGLGATLYEMVAGSPPFGGADFAELTSNVLRLNYRLPDELSVEVRRLIDGMLQINPNDRSSVEDLCREPWVAASGGLVDEAPNTGVDIECVECDTASWAGKCADKAAGTRPPAWRRVGLYLVYGAIVAYALLSHKRKAVQDET